MEPHRIAWTHIPIPQEVIDRVNQLYIKDEKNQISFIGKVIKSKKIIFKMQKKEKFKININSLEEKYKKDLFSI